MAQGLLWQFYRVIKRQGQENEKKIFDIVCFVGGTYLVAYSLLSPEGLLFRGCSYETSTKIIFALGCCIIVLGFLVNKWRKEVKK